MDLKKYYFLKQHGFNGLSLYNIINLNSINTVALSLSPLRAASLRMASVLAISWFDSLFFSRLKNYIPNIISKTKTVVNGLKFGKAFSIHYVDWASNQIFGFVENTTVGHQLPITDTEAYKFSVGPKLKNLAEMKKLLTGF